MFLFIYFQNCHRWESWSYIASLAIVPSLRMSGGWNSIHVVQRQSWSKRHNRQVAIVDVFVSAQPVARSRSQWTFDWWCCMDWSNIRRTPTSGCWCMLLLCRPAVISTGELHGISLQEFISAVVRWRYSVYVEVNLRFYFLFLICSWSAHCFLCITGKSVHIQIVRVWNIVSAPAANWLFQQCKGAFIATRPDPMQRDSIVSRAAIN